MRPTVELLADVPLIGPEEYDPLWDDIDDRHYDRNGELISFRSWCRLREFFPGIVRVAEDTVGPYWVSTVWLGLNHGFGWRSPLIFETMVFKGDKSDLDCRRYSTEEEAQEGHAAMVEEVRLMVDAAS